MADADTSPPRSAGQTDQSRTSLLFVCVANVCRSPTMTFLTGAHLAEHGIAPPWDLLSAGTQASDGQRMCREAASNIQAYPGGREFAQQHRSQSLSADLIEQSGLILVASQQERAAITRLSREARTRTFTMVEAARLADAGAGRGASPWQPGQPLALDALVAVLHERRGTLEDATPPGLRGWLSRLRPQDPLDIRDVHTGEVRSHAPVAASLESASSMLSQAVARLADQRGESPTPGTL